MERYPLFFKAYKNANQYRLNHHPSRQLGTDGDLMFDWWISKKGADKFIAESNREDK